MTTKRLVLAFGAFLAAAAPVTQAGAVVAFSDDERATILGFGPWPPAWSSDASNRVSGNRAAVALGRRLFNDRRLSKGGALSCADCHQADRHFTDGVALNRGHGPLTRHTPGLANLRWASWFGWGGEADNLWAQSVRPIRAENEMAMTPSDVRRTIAGDAVLSCRYRTVFDTPAAGQDAETVLVNVGKALAAFQETLVSGRTLFDAFRDALERGEADGDYGDDAKRGLKIFIGRGNCHFCHFGPQFTNGEFGDIGVPYFIGPGQVDRGRHGGIAALKASWLNLLGPFSDDRTGARAVRTRHVTPHHRNWGEFKVPSLRNVAETAPYTHNGSVATLDAMIDFYSELNEERLHADGEKVLRPLHLSGEEKADLRAFLRTLSAPIGQVDWARAPYDDPCGD